jgi:hypothetical protein
MRVGSGDMADRNRRGPLKHHPNKLTPRDRGTPMTDSGKVTDDMLDKISDLVKERDQLKADLMVAVEAALSRVDS